MSSLKQAKREIPVTFRAMSTTENMSGKNAFSVLMTKKTNDGATPGTTLRRTLSIGTEFIVCPAGCGKRMLEKEINQHLDRCIRLQQNDADDCCQATQSQSEASSQEQSILSSQLLTQPTSGIVYGSNMTTSKKRRRVTCPSCQNSFPSALINLHLDQCINRTRSSTKKCSRSSPSAGKSIVNISATEINTPSKNATDISDSLAETGDDTAVNGTEDGLTNFTEILLNDASQVDGTGIQQEPVESDVDESNPSYSQIDTSSIVACKKKPQPSDSISAFATMMKQSKAMFGKKDKSTRPLHLLFHLDESLRVRLSYPMTVETEWKPPIWSVLMNVRDKFSNIPDLENPNQPSSIKIEVTVSTDIPGYINQPTRWIRHHSQLSVPVLKSILQKSIRRRKPLPAVRVAMELADKALGELLRRLPVIMFEDSYLHPDIHLLIWIMMAYTKDYQPPSKVMIRIFQIIYEIAACQWSDPLPMIRNSTESAAQEVTLTSLFNRHSNEINPAATTTKESETASSSFDDGTTYIWSILVRAEYGGLKCDIEMLHQYAKLWSDRFSSVYQQNIHETIVQQLAPCSTTKDPSTEKLSTDNQLLWCNVPTYLHQKSREQGLDRVLALCNHGVDRLLFDDICIEGIDYHCSGIINTLMSDEYLCDICFDLMTLAEASLQPIETTTNLESMSSATHNQDRRNNLEFILKLVIWNFSSNVNHRRPLLIEQLSHGTADETKNDSHSRYTGLWNDLIAPRVLEYQRKYVQQRMVR